MDRLDVHQVSSTSATLSRLSVLLLALTLVTWSSPAAAESNENKPFTCPAVIGSNCNCSVNPNEISCVDSAFSSVPTDWPSEVNILKLTRNRDPIVLLSEIPYFKLVYLHLDDNGIRFIFDFAFSKLSGLEKLTLSGNKITGLTNATFAGLNSLEILVLENNPIHFVNPGVFHGAALPKLQDLKLSHCSLYHIAPGGIKDLTNLRVLFLNNNSLSEFPNLDDGLSSLTHLNMSMNQITSIHSEKFQIPKSLIELNLSNNTIRSVHLYISESSKLASSSLSDLRLSNNRINDFASSNLHLWRSLAAIDLDGNLLEKVNGDQFPWKGGNLSRVLFGNNPWDCTGCHNSWITNQAIVRKWNEPPIRCAAPDSLKDQSPFTSPAFIGCGGSTKSPGSSTAIILSVVVVGMIVIVLVFFIVVGRRRRRGIRRDSSRTFSGGYSGLSGAIKGHHTGTPGSSLASNSFSYKQMKNNSSASPFSIVEEE